MGATGRRVSHSSVIALQDKATLDPEVGLGCLGVGVGKVR